MRCHTCESEVCPKKHHCDDKSWVVPIIVALSRYTDSSPTEVKEEIDKEIELTHDEFFLCWKAAELFKEWSAK